MRTFLQDGSVSVVPGATEGVPAPDGTLPLAPMGEHGFGSDGRDAPALIVPHVPPVRVRHGAFARHHGTVSATFTVAYNGQVIEMRAGQALAADDGLRDAIEGAHGPVAWRD